MRKNHPIFVCLIAFFLSTCVYAYLLPASDKNLQPRPAMPEIPGQGFVDPDLFKTRSYTLDCQCVYDANKKQWDATDKTCLFINECKACTSEDKTCEIRYPAYGSSDIFKKTFYANDQKKVKSERCTVANTAKMICTPLPEGGGESCKLDPQFVPNVVCKLINEGN